MAKGPEQTKNTPRAQKERSKIADYPRQTIFKTAGGHTFSFNNSEDNPSMMFTHPNGTHMEWHPDGTITQHQTGDMKQTTKGGVVISIDENNDVKITGHNKLQVSGGQHIEVAGDAGIIVAGEVMLGGMKNFAATFDNLYLGARGNFNVNVEGDTMINTKGTSTMVSDGNMTMATRADLAVGSGGDTGIAAGGDLTTQAQGSNFQQGAEVHHNSGGASAKQNGTVLTAGAQTGSGGGGVFA